MFIPTISSYSYRVCICYHILYSLLHSICNWNLHFTIDIYITFHFCKCVCVRVCVCVWERERESNKALTELNNLRRNDRRLVIAAVKEGVTDVTRKLDKSSRNYDLPVCLKARVLGSYQQYWSDSQQICTVDSLIHWT